MKNLLKLVLSLGLAGVVGCATTPNYYRSDHAPLPAINPSIPRMAGEWDFDYRLAGLKFGSEITDITNGFHEMDNAAIEILTVLIPLSKATSREYGGYIYEKDNRFYFTNPPVKGSGIVVDVHLAKRLVPAGAKVVGDYHTHFRDKTGETQALDDSMKNHDFSLVDIEGIKSCSHQYPDYKGYLGTQAQSIQVFAPHSDVALYAIRPEAPGIRLALATFGGHTPEDARLPKGNRSKLYRMMAEHSIDSL